MKLVAPTRGIQGITNKLKVRWSPTLSDDALAKTVMRNLFGCSTTKRAADDVGIQVTEGIVTLSGHVNSRRIRHEFIRVASETDGIRTVVDELKVTTSVPK
jgi:osmotically-inducible protein OsmY